jgi:teichoic acid transport system permease protein
VTTTEAARGYPELDGLIDVRARQPVGRYLADVWDRREYIMRVPIEDLRAKNFDTVLGNLWHLLNPLLLIGVYYLVFGVILSIDRGVDNFIAFLAVGILTFQFTQKAALQGAKSIVNNEGLIRSLQFPRAILPMSTVLGETLAHGPALLVMFAVAAGTGETITPLWLLVPLLVVPLQVLFNLGLAFFTARATDAFRDVENVLPFVFRIAFYMSGILYSVDARVDDATFRALFALNPIYCFASLARFLVLGDPFNSALLLSAVLWTVLLLSIGFAVFRAGELTYGRG